MNTYRSKLKSERIIMMIRQLHHSESWTISLDDVFIFSISRMHDVLLLRLLETTKRNFRLYPMRVEALDNMTVHIMDAVLDDLFIMLDKQLNV